MLMMIVVKKNLLVVELDLKMMDMDYSKEFVKILHVLLVEMNMMLNGKKKKVLSNQEEKIYNILDPG